MADRGKIFSTSEAKRTHAVVKRAEQQPIFTLPPIRKVPRLRSEGSGSGGATLQFEITEVGVSLGALAADCDYVEAEVITPPCNSSVEEGDEIRVFDAQRCMFNMPASVLIGLKGWATRVVNDTYGNDDCVEGLLDQEGACKWEVITLCCAEEEYA